MPSEALKLGQPPNNRKSPANRGEDKAQTLLSATGTLVRNHQSALGGYPQLDTLRVHRIHRVFLLILHIL